MVFEILWKAFSAVQSFLKLSVGYVSGNYDCSVEAQACGNRILGQYLENVRNRLVEVYLNSVAFSSLAEFFRNQTPRIVVKLFNPDTVFVYLGFYVAVCRAANAQSDRAACAVARQADDSNIVSQILAAELSAKPDLVCFFQNLLFKLNVSESPAALVAGGWEIVVEFG